MLCSTNTRQLGLVTLLGAPEVNNHVGKLVRSRYLEYLPLLGSYIIASDEFTSKQTGFQLYNVDAGIYTPDSAGWFTRWLMTQDFRTASSYVQWSVEYKPYSFWKDVWLAGGIGLVINRGFMAVTLLMGDWWGFANAMSMAFSTTCRAYLVDKNRSWIDRAVEIGVKAHLDELKGKKAEEPDSEVIFDANDIATLACDKLIIVLSDIRTVALSIPKCLIVNCFVLTPKPQNSNDETKRAPSSFPTKAKDGPENVKSVEVPRELRYYQLVRAVAWFAFGAHVVTIGMSCLVSQLFTVVIIVLPTVLMTYGVGSSTNRVGSRLKATVSDLPHKDPSEEKRSDMYAFLNLSDDQDKSLRKWSMTPQKGEVSWWADYAKRKELYNKDMHDGKSPLIEIGTYKARAAELKVRVDARAAADKANTAANTANNQPATTQPATTQPATTQPATTQPATAQPPTAPPATTQPATHPATTTQPVTTQPARNPPAATPAPVYPKHVPDPQC